MCSRNIKRKLSVTIKTIPLLFDSLDRANSQYQFFDKILQNKLSSKNVKIRQAVSPSDFQKVSEARIRMYSQRKRYYQTLFGDSTGLDEVDYRSFVFYLMDGDKIVGVHRVTPAPYEVSKYIPGEMLTSFIGLDYKEHYVEFSRLVVDKDFHMEGAVQALGCTVSALITINTQFSKYITYAKPRLKESSFDMIGDDGLYFEIPERGAHIYSLYKGNLLEVIKLHFDTNEYFDELYKYHSTSYNDIALA